MLRILLLGPFQVERDGQVIPRQAWTRPKDRAVLKRLALDRGHLVPQDRLLDELWPDLAPGSAANSLHAAVSRLRKLLGPATIRREAAGYTLAATDSVWIDVEAFWRLLGQGREWRRRGAWAPAVQAYRAAAALYRGELFEDDPYEEWTLRPREQLREAHLALLEELADGLLHVGALAEAIERCERGLAEDRTREGFYVQLMRSHGVAGRVAEALQVYERCRRALAEELGVGPGPAVRAIHAQLLRDDGLGAASLSSDPSALATAATTERSAAPAARPPRDRLGQLHLPCVGREQELADLASRLATAQAGQGQLVLIHGEPGIGKSRLLEEVSQLAESRGVRQLTARCYEMERDLPYAPVVDALGRFLLERAALLAGLTHVLISLSRSTPLVLLLDDLQWADGSTAQWLHYLARRLSGEWVLVVGTYRSNEVGPNHPLQRLLDSLAGDPAAPPLLELPCLGVEHVAALLPAISGSAARGRAMAARLHRETDGHPLFLIETLRTLLETGVLRLDEQGRWEEASATIQAPERRLPIPPNVREAIRWRVRRLNERERRVLMAAAVVERGFRPELLAGMTELTSDTVLDALEALNGRHLVRPSPAGSGFDFRHDLIQAVVYGDLGPDRRRSFHARAAEMLEAQTEERRQAVREVAGELAHHWREAEQWVPAFRYALLAGDHAREAFAPREALVHYLRAAEIADRHPGLVERGDRVGLLERLGRAHADLGELDAAIHQFQSLRDLARGLDDGVLETRVLLALADSYFMRHDFEPAERLAAEALRRAEAMGNRGLRAGSLATAAGVAMAQGRTDDAARHCAAVLTLVGDIPVHQGNEDSVVAGARLNALGWLGLLREFQADHERAMPAIEASLRLGHELHNPFLTARSRFALGMSLGNRGRYEEAIAALAEALRLAEEAGDRYWLPRLPNTIGWVYSELGDLRQAEEWNRRSIALARETGWLEAEANALVNLGSDSLRAGRRSAAREHFERAAALIERDEWFTWRYRMRLLLGLADLALLDGAPERALTFAQQALALAEPTGSRKHAGRARLLRGRAMLAAGAPIADILAEVERAQALAHASGHPPLRWTSDSELARLHARLGHEPEAAACRAEALAAIEAVAGRISDPALRGSFLGSDSVQRVLAGA